MTPTEFRRKKRGPWRKGASPGVPRPMEEVEPGLEPGQSRARNVSLGGELAICGKSHTKKYTSTACLAPTVLEICPERGVLKKRKPGYNRRL